MNSIVWLVSLQIQSSNNADVLLDSGLNLFDIIANLCSKVYEVLLKSGYYIVHLLKQTPMFRTWIVRFGHPVWVHKLTDIVTSLCSVFVNWTKIQLNVIHIWNYSNHQIISIWNKWKCVSVNKLWTLIKSLPWKNREGNTWMDKSDKWIRFLISLHFWWTLKKQLLLGEWQGQGIADIW